MSPKGIDLPAWSPEDEEARTFVAPKPAEQRDTIPDIAEATTRPPQVEEIIDLDAEPEMIVEEKPATPKTKKAPAPPLPESHLQPIKKEKVKEILVAHPWIDQAYEGGPAALATIKQLLETEDRRMSDSDPHAPPLDTKEGKAIFASLGSKLFERDPWSFRENFGYGHQLFSPREERIKVATNIVSQHELGPQFGLDRLLADKVILIDEAVGVLYNLEPADQKRIERAMTKAKEGSPLFELKERLDSVKEYERLNEQLLAAAEKELPHLAPLIADRRKKQQHLRSHIQGMRPIGSGVSSSLFIQTDTSNGVYKPALHEPGNEHGDGTGGMHYRLSLRTGETIGAEILTPLLGLLTNTREALGAEFINGPIGPGSIQEYREGKVLGRAHDDEWHDGWTLKPEYKTGLERIAALDVLAQSSDRHLNNILIHEGTKQVFAIDNGLSQTDPDASAQEVKDTILQELGRHDLIGIPLEELPREVRRYIEDLHRARTNYNDDLLSHPVAFLADQPINPEILQNYKQLQAVLEDESSEVRAALLELYSHFMGKDGRGQKRFDLMRQRLDFLVFGRRYPRTSHSFQDNYLSKLEKRMLRQQARRVAPQTPKQPTP